MGKTYFENALIGFVQDFADGGAIRRLADQGLTVPQIAARLDFPLSKEKIGELVWEYYTGIGRIRLTQPEAKDEPHRVVRYVKEQNAYGRSSMRQIVEELPSAGEEFLPCDFGRMMYRDKNSFLKKLEQLSGEDRDYVLYLPWPLQRVWHIREPRICRVIEAAERE